ncbi:MAG: hypothetical protein M0R76_02830 [Proteobacteria bacterium]|nr:hypothetical protein [Pseudomonadota bacterium]
MKSLARITWLTLLLIAFGNIACNDEGTSRVPASNNNNGDDSDVGTNTDPGRSSDTFPQNTDFPPIDTTPVNTGDPNPVNTDDTNPQNTDDTNPQNTDDTNPQNTDDTNPQNTDDTNPPTGDCNDNNSTVISTEDWTDIPTSGLACFKLVPNDGWAYDDVRVKVENNNNVPVAGQAAVVGKSGYTLAHDFTAGSELTKTFLLGRSNANSAAPYYIKITGSPEKQRIAWEYASTPDPDTDTTPEDTDPVTGDCNDSNSTPLPAVNWFDIPTSGLACFKIVPNDNWAYPDVLVKVENNSGVPVAGQAEVVGKSGYTLSHDFTPGSEVLKTFLLGRSNANSAAPYYIKITGSTEGQRIAWEYVPANP